MQAWSTMMREPTRPWEVAIIRALDGVFLKAAAERRRKASLPK
jgi:hypothetical protein